jgi:ABC-type nitrate/sulfonate/bicarbonate transport system substrate-binding protein
MRTTRVAAGVIAAVLLFVAACGGGSGSGSTTPSAASGAVETVKLGGVSKANAGNWFYLIALNEGMFDKYKIKLDRILAPTSAAAITALLAGEVDLTGPTFDAGMQAQANAPSAKWIAMGYDKLPYTLISPKTVNSVQDLRGKTCGAQVPNAVDGLYIKMMISSLSGGTMKPGTDYEITAFGSAGLAPKVAALNTNQVACVATVPPEVGQLEAMGYKVLARSSQVPGMTDFPFFGIISTEKFYGQRPEVAARMLASVMEAIVFLYDPANKDRAIDILAKEAEVDRAAAAQAYEYVTTGGFRPDLKVTPADLLTASRVLQQTGQNPPIPGLDQAKAAQLIATGPAEAAYKLLDPEMQKKVDSLMTSRGK